MKILNSFDDIPKNLQFAFSIGVFDGVHLGHEALISALKKTLSPTLILTFTNHPAEILRPNSVPKMLLSVEKKLLILKQHEIDYVLLIPFTQELSQTSFDALLDKIPLAHFVIGKGDSFGRAKLGNEENLKAYAEKRRTGLTIVEKNEISSSLIRKLLEANDFEKASSLMGRPYTPEKSI